MEIKDQIAEIVYDDAELLFSLGEQFGTNKNIPIVKFITNEEVFEYADILMLFWDGEEVEFSNMKQLASEYEMTCIEVLINE